MKRYFVYITGLVIVMMFSCQKEENTSLLDVVEPEQSVSTIAGDAFFACKNREDSLKNRIIAALQHKNNEQGGIVQQSVAPYGQPLWDESESVTVDSAVRILVPMYDSLAKDIVGLWCFDNRLGKDSVYYGVSEVPPALNDTAFAIDLSLVYDYFRFKLELPTERNIKFEFEENNNINTASSGNGIVPQSMIIEICTTMCGYVSVGNGEWVEKGCFTTCEFYSIPTYEDQMFIELPPIEGGGGGSNDDQKKTYTITVSANTGGFVIGGGTYPMGQLISISAQVHENYRFEYWMLNGSVVSTNRTYVLTVSQNQSYVAKFISEDCYNKRKIAEDALLNGAANLLKGEAQNKTNEVARFETFNYNGNNTSLSGSRDGIAGEAGFPNLNGGTYNWMFHSHPAGQGVIFSGRDLISLYQIYAQHLYTDLSSFLFGVVNHLGSGYALSITDPLLFEQFARLYQLDGSSPEYIINELDYQISLYDISRAEKVFTELINGSGLSLLKVNSIGSSQNTWDVITYNNNIKKVTVQPCD
jgi:hypothetical protein